MKCPKCPKQEMQRSVYKSVEVERCPKCQGVWLDKGKLESILEQKVVKLDESGDFTLTENPMNYRTAHCPKCDRDMMVLDGADDIRFDWCEQCEGMFFDCGELTVLRMFDAD